MYVKVDCTLKTPLIIVHIGDVVNQTDFSVVSADFNINPSLLTMLVITNTILFVEGDVPILRWILNRS